MLAYASPFEITKVTPAQECYVDKTTLQVFKVVVFTGTFKMETDEKWTITVLQAEFRTLQAHADV